MALFKVLARGSWRPDEIIITPNSSFHQLPSGWRDEIEMFWQQKKTQGHFNGPMLRLENYRTVDSALHLELSTTDYKTLLFCNEYTEKILSGHSVQTLARSLGVSAVVKSKDRQIVLMLRSAQVGEYPLCYDLFGGHIDADLLHDPHAVFTAIQRELAEEAALAKNDYSLQCFGLIVAMDHYKPELLFVADCRLVAADIVAQARSAIDRHEYEKLVCLSNDSSAIRYFMERNENVTPSAVGCLEEYTQWMKTKLIEKI